MTGVDTARLEATIRDTLKHTLARVHATGAHPSWCRGCEADVALDDLLALVARLTDEPAEPEEAQSPTNRATCAPAGEAQALVAVRCCAGCGHLVAEHRAEVLPFAVCRHVDGERIDAPGLASHCYRATPCWCSNYVAGAA